VGFDLGRVPDVGAAAARERAARRWATRLADGPTEALVTTRKLLHGSGTLDDALVTEDVAQGRLGAQPDFMEGALAFIQKRKPDFRGESPQPSLG
jgi:2-(1,2-epoxy-1,2-dihydrophenyl)acetyl-CoA isomerase